MNDQVNEFLRRVAAKRAEAERQRAAPPPPPPPVQSSPLQQRRLLADEEVVELSMVDERTTEAFSGVSRQLGQGVSQQSQQVGKHVHEVFDHTLGALKATATSDLAPKSALPTNSLVAQLIKPQSIQQAIIMNEILRRPDHLWDD